MTKTTLATGFALTLALPGLALAANFAEIDANGDGYITMSEFQQAYPDAEAGTFSAVDTNADGSLTEEELTAAMDAGKLPEKSGG